VFIGLFDTEDPFVAAGAGCTPPANGRLMGIVVGVVRATVLFGDDPGLLNPLVRVGVGVVDGDAEKRLEKRRRPPGG
jgi:hypothetical protein